MRVCSLVLSMLLASATAALGQNQGSGIKGGVNFAEVTIEEADVSTDRRTGFIGGVFFQLPVAPHFSVQFEGLYAQKGGTLDGDDTGVDAELEFDYFQFPVLIRWDSTEAGDSRFNVFAGPSFNFNHRAVAKSDSEEEDLREADQIETFDLGLVVGAGMEFGNFLIDGRYEHGLRTINKNAGEDGFKTKNRAFSFMAGFRF